MAVIIFSNHHSKAILESTFKNKGNLAKPYQLRQVLNAPRKLQELEKQKTAKKDE